MCVKGIWAFGGTVMKAKRYGGFRCISMKTPIIEWASALVPPTPFLGASPRGCIYIHVCISMYPPGQPEDQGRSPQILGQGERIIFQTKALLWFSTLTQEERRGKSGSYRHSAKKLWQHSNCFSISERVNRKRHNRTLCSPGLVSPGESLCSCHATRWSRLSVWGGELRRRNGDLEVRRFQGRRCIFPGRSGCICWLVFTLLKTFERRGYPKQNPTFEHLGRSRTEARGEGGSRSLGFTEGKGNECRKVFEWKGVGLERPCNQQF